MERMRLLVAVAALLLLLPTMGVSAQEAGAAVVSDAAADVRTEAQGTAGPAPGDAYSSMDLTGLAITETMSDVTFTLTVADYKPADQQTAVDGVRFQVHFAHNGRWFLLTLDQSLPALTSSWFSSLDMRDTPDAEWTQVWFGLEGRADPEAETVSVTLDRNLLADKDGAMPFPGRALEGIVVHSSAFLSNVTIFGGMLPDVRSPVKVLDDMPDAGQPPARYAIIVGLAQSGHALLSSEVPYRASNGEATTFLLSATANNRADREDTFEFEAVGAPPRLAVTVPVTLAAIPAGGSIDIPVLVTIPFAHIHGGVDDFALEMRSTSDPGSVGRVAMGVRYLSVPQPAGHHDSLYLHSSGGTGTVGNLVQDGYMNTLEDDASDTKQPIQSTGLSINGDSFTHSWYFSLEPGLQMGLDFDLQRNGSLAVPIGSPVLAQVDTSLAATLSWGSPFGDSMPVASMTPTAPVTILPQSTHLFEGVLVPSPDADRIPFQPGANLFLEVDVTTKTPSLIVAEQPFVAPGGHLTLPLLEYHDPVDDALAALDGPGLSPLGAQERLVNPGKAIVFPFSLANPADGERSYVVEVSGSNHEWGSLPADRIKVPAHGTASGSLIVRAPAAATDGDRADLILQAYDASDPTVRGLLRLLAEVDTDAQHPDDTVAADELSKTKDSPSLGAGLAVLALAALAQSLRRRR